MNKIPPAADPNPGVVWLRGNGITAISPLGERVAGLLDDLFSGIYHLPRATRVDWSDDQCIIVPIEMRELATYDGNSLTRLVFLAHDRCLRVSINPRSPQSLNLFFHRRWRDGAIYARHPTLAAAVAEHRQLYPEETTDG